MSHVQQQIIDALNVALAGSGIVGAASVFKERVDPVPASALPAIQFEESPDGEEVGDIDLEGIQERTYAISVACLVQHNEGYGDQARELGLRVEKLLAGNGASMQPLIDLCAGGISIGSGVRMVYSGDGDEAIAVRLQVWKFIYNVHQAHPDRANYSPIEEEQS